MIANSIDNNFNLASVHNCLLLYIHKRKYIFIDAEIVKIFCNFDTWIAIQNIVKEKRQDI